MSQATAQISSTPAVVFPDFGAQPAVKKPRKRRADRKTPAELHPDFLLIDACIDFAKHTASRQAAFSVDPTGNNDFAEFHDNIGMGPTRKCLETAAKTPALTLDGLRAKAALVEIILDDLDCAPLEDFHDKFLRMFAADVVRFQRIAAPTDVVFREQDR